MRKIIPCLASRTWTVGGRRWTGLFPYLVLVAASSGFTSPFGLVFLFSSQRKGLKSMTKHLAAPHCIGALYSGQESIIKSVRTVVHANDTSKSTDTQDSHMLQQRYRPCCHANAFIRPLRPTPASVKIKAEIRMIEPGKKHGVRLPTAELYHCKPNS